MFDGSKWQQARVAHCMCSIYLTWKKSQESIPGKGGWLGYNPDKAVMEGQLHGFCAECAFFCCAVILAYQIGFIHERYEAAQTLRSPGFIKY